jgi:hypothetical protein
MQSECQTKLKAFAGATAKHASEKWLDAALSTKRISAKLLRQSFIMLCFDRIADWQTKCLIECGSEQHAITKSFRV